MSKQQQINEDIKQAMRDKNTTKLNVLRSLKNSITNAALQSGNAGNSLDDLKIVAIIRGEITKREDASAQFTKGNRPDLADNENIEIALLNEYLPKELTEEELDIFLAQAISETGATSKKHMGAVIKRTIELVEGRASNKRISAIVGKLLA